MQRIAIEIKDGKAKCCICGERFPLVIDKHYISRDNGQVGIATMFKVIPEDQLYDTFDCPHCGCQNVVQNRKRRDGELILIGEDGVEQAESQLENTVEEEQDA